MPCKTSISSLAGWRAGTIGETWRIGLKIRGQHDAAIGEIHTG